MYTLTNFVGCLKNNIRSKKDYVDVSFSLLVEKCLTILLNEGYILGYCLVNKKTLRIFLKYFKGRSVIYLYLVFENIDVCPILLKIKINLF